MKVLDPWGGELVEDYSKIVKDFGLELFDSKKFPAPNRLMRRGVVFAGRDLAVISNAIKSGKKFYVLSGIMPTADKIHFGNKMVIENMAYFQKLGAETYMLVADLEAAAARGITIAEARQRALDFQIPAYLALGLDYRKTKFYFQSENKDVIHLAYEFARKITLNEFKAIYGSADPGRIMSAVTQVGDVLYPQLKERMPGIIPVGIDQDPHIRLSRDVIKRVKDKYNFSPLASIYHKYTPALNGSIKMSKSHPESMIELPEDPSSACKKINRGITGGRDTLEEHRRLGAVIEKDMVFELLKQHLVEDDAELTLIHDEYKSGRMTSGELKKIACEKYTWFHNKFVSDLEKSKKLVDKLDFVRFS